MITRFNCLGVSFSAVNLAQAKDQVLAYSYHSPGYICFPDASVVKDASEDAHLTNILNNSYLTLPDGKPSQLAARLQGHKHVSTVSGYHLCRQLLQTKLTHYFYGSDKEGLLRIKTALEKEFPDARILGYKCPPYIGKQEIANSETIRKDIEEINRLQPDLIWVGISSPKQDYLMYHHHTALNKSLMLGIGGALIYFADDSLKSPEWVKKMGLRWAYRLIKEPKRLGPKYYATFKFLVQNRSFFLKLLFKKNAAAKVAV